MLWGFWGKSRPVLVWIFHLSRQFFRQVRTGDMPLNEIFEAFELGLSHFSTFRNHFMCSLRGSCIWEWIWSSFQLYNLFLCYLIWSLFGSIQQMPIYPDRHYNLPCCFFPELSLRKGQWISFYHHCSSSNIFWVSQFLIQLSQREETVRIQYEFSWTLSSHNFSDCCNLQQ